MATQTLGEAFLLPMHGGVLVASTAASHRTNETLKILLEGVIAKLYVFMYVFVYLFIFHCGKSKYLAVFSLGLIFYTKSDCAQGMVQKMAA